MNTSNFHSYSLFLEEANELDHLAALLDPLGADVALRQLPMLNQSRNSEGIKALLLQLLPTADRVAQFSLPECLAAMRDLGLLLGSMKRHGIEPERHVPTLASVLLQLGERTDLPPRDTLLHYAVWNPADERMRTYTGTQDERHLIMSVQQAFPHLNRAIGLLQHAHHVSPESVDYEQIFNKISEQIDGMVKAMLIAYKNVSSAYFAQELRLYYDPITVGGRTYLGPGAVEMPMFVLDHLLWASDWEDETYRGFQEAYLPYILPNMREIYYAHDWKPSLITKINDWVTDQENEQVVKNRNAIRQLFMDLKSFRMPHKKMAESAYQAQKQREVGSGGYATSILVHINQQMENAFDRLFVLF